MTRLSAKNDDKKPISGSARACIHTGASARIGTFGQRRRNPTTRSERGKAAGEEGREPRVGRGVAHTRIFTYVQAVVYIRAILSRNIKRDCMADLCKYLWPASKRVLLTEPWEEGGRIEEPFRARTGPPGIGTGERVQAVKAYTEGVRLGTPDAGAFGE